MEERLLIVLTQLEMQREKHLKGVVNIQIVVLSVIQAVPAILITVIE